MFKKISIAILISTTITIGALAGNIKTGYYTNVNDFDHTIQVKVGQTKMKIDGIVFTMINSEDNKEMYQSESKELIAYTDVQIFEDNKLNRLELYEYDLELREITDEALFILIPKKLILE